MKAILILSITWLFNCPNVFAQEDSLPTVVEAERVFTKVEQEVDFEGGMNAWRTFLGRNLNASVPADKGAPAGKYTVIIRFIVDTDGSINSFSPETKHGYGMEEEVIRVLSKSPKWQPAQQNGRKVKAYRRQPISFVVEEEEGKKSKRKKG